MEVSKEKIGQSGKVTWESPSNIALVKYWGKFGRQYPKNTSLSFTLKEAKSITQCTYTVLPNPADEIQLKFKFEGIENEAFGQKIKKFISSISDILPFVFQLEYQIESRNTFPHSTGIASSASAMSALSLCLCSIAEELGFSIPNFYQTASTLSRLGSGSASRSVFPQLALWGNHPEIPNSSNDYAVPYVTNVDPIFQDYHDDILIVSSKEKSVSSTAGHALMNDNPYAETRYQQANDNIIKLVKAIADGNLEEFIKIVESEALTLHALMMCSDPSYILMEANTLKMINEIRAFRSQSNIPVCFTLDAGPNIHLLYPDQYKEAVQKFTQEKLLDLTQSGIIIRDQVGKGPTLIES